jgi:hypothetical protein
MTRQPPRSLGALFLRLRAVWFYCCSPRYTAQRSLVSATQRIGPLPNMACALSQICWLLFLISTRVLSLTIEDSPSTVVVGQKYTITWSPQDDTVSDRSKFQSSPINALLLSPQRSTCWEDRRMTLALIAHSFVRDTLPTS